MSDRELADAVVVLLDGPYILDDGRVHWPCSGNVSVKIFVRDWRVAGALMEKMAEKYRSLSKKDRRSFPIMFHIEMLCDPHAVIEACVEVLT